jgi:glycosyltransferase involved in cell wall biosynthesis
MRILQINNFLKLKGGSDRVFIDTSNLLCSKGHDVAVFYSGDSLNVEPLNIIIKHYRTEDILSSESNAFRKSMHFLKNTQALNDLTNALEEFKPDIVHLHIFQSRLSSAIISLINNLKIPMIMSVHEYKMTCPVYTHLDSNGVICEKCKPKSYLPCVINKCVNNSLSKSLLIATESLNRDLFHNYLEKINHFIMVSEFILRKHALVYPEQQHKFTKLYNFIDGGRFKGEYFFGDYILYFGRLSKEKGVDNLLMAAKICSSIKFKIAGTGDNLENLKSLILELGLKNVEFLGFKSGEELVQLIEKSRFTIVPSKWFENNPMNVIESFALGKPVIGSKIGGIPELIFEGKTGYLSEYNDPEDLSKVILKAWDQNEEDYKVMSMKCSLFAEENFNSNNHYSELMELYHKTLNLKP